MWHIFGRSVEQEELEVRRNTLQSKVKTLGWWYLVSTVCYIILYFLVRSNSEGHRPYVLQIMILAITPFSAAKGISLIKGATDQNLCTLEIGLWLCVTVAMYNTVLGIMGAVYFVPIRRWAVHYIITFLFFNLSLTLVFTLCYDVLLITAYKKLLN